MNAPQFYVVWSPQGFAPKFRHGSETSAEEEAKRLARENPGKKFHVLAHIGTAFKEEVTYSRVENRPF